MSLTSSLRARAPRRSSASGRPRAARRRRARSRRCAACRSSTDTAHDPSRPSLAGGVDGGAFFQVRPTISTIAAAAASAGQGSERRDIARQRSFGVRRSAVRRSRRRRRRSAFGASTATWSGRSKTAEHLLEPLRRRDRASPEPSTDSRHSLACHPSFSRSSFIPRCRFTRTDAGVSPDRSAISAPLIPSTSRISSVSRYASGSVRTMSRTAKRLRFDRIAAGHVVRQLDLLVRLAQIVGRAVARDGGDPAAERRRVAQLADAGVGGEKHVLHQIVDVAARDAPEQDRVDHPRRSRRRGARRHRGRRRRPRESSPRQRGGRAAGRVTEIAGGENAASSSTCSIQATVTGEDVGDRRDVNRRSSPRSRPATFSRLTRHMPLSNMSLCNISSRASSIAS